MLFEATQLPQATMSVTRQLAAALTELRAQGKPVHHLGAGYPNPEVSDPTHYILAGDRYYDLLAGRQQVVGDRARVLSESFGYTDTLGPRDARESFAQVYGRDFGFNMDPAHLVPTQGATGGIDILCSLFESSYPNLAYLVDAPTYPGLISRANRRQFGPKFYSVAMDDQGPIPESLREQIRQARQDGFFIPFYYTIPDGHNPAGISFSQERREALYQVACEENILLAEDAPYTYISFEEARTRPKPFVAMDTEGRVVHLFTASKIGLPGPRVGYAYAPGKIKIAGNAEVSLSGQLTAVAAGTGLMHNPAALRGFAAYLHAEDGQLRDSLWPIADAKIQVYQGNRDILLGGLKAALGADSRFSWTTPGAGFFSVFTYEDGVLPTSAQLALELVQKFGVTSVPMETFYAPGTPATLGARQLRLAFSFTEGTGQARLDQIQAATTALTSAILTMAR